MRPSDFIADFFSASTGPIYFCSLPNERNGGRPAEICGRGGGDRLDELVLHHWDKPDRGTFFCINTVQPGQARRAKETVFEITCLHADVDFAKIDMTPDAALHEMGELEFLPSKVVASAHGYHAYWLLSEAMPATPELIAQVEDLLRKLADMLSSDPAVCEVARLMRLPGSHNTKDGGRIPVQVVVDNPYRYELGDLAEWIAETRPVIPRKSTTPNGNPFLDARIPGSAKPAEHWRGIAANGADEGCRDDTATRLAGHLFRRYVDPLVVLELLLCWNAHRCRPPLPERDIERIVDSIAGRELRRRGGG